MNDTLSIQEFAKTANLCSSKLRYWNEIGLFSPKSRDPDNNFRRYSSAQLLELNFIKTLSYLDVPLKQIAKLRDERSPEELLLILDRLEKKMDMEMHDLRQRYSVIHARRELIHLGLNADVNKISVMHLDERAMILWPRNEYNEGDTFIEPLSNHVVSSNDRRVNLSFPIGARHDSMKSFLKAPARPNNFLSIDPVGSLIRKAGEYLVGFTRGNYLELGDLPERMDKYAREHSIALSGPVYTIYLLEEISTSDTSQYLAKCSVAVRNPKR